MIPMNLEKFQTINRTAPHGALSPKYSFASTKGLIDTFSDSGWFPVDCQESRTRSPEKSGYQKHCVVLHNPVLEQGLAVSTTAPRIMLKNSHDGTSSLQMLSGLFERICANGLVVGARATDIRIKHVSVTEEALRAAMQECLRALEAALNISERMKAITLDPTQQLNLAQDVIEMVWEDGAYSILPNQLLWNYRQNQRVPTLWNTYNTIQERIIRGGVSQQRADGTRIRSREVKSIDRSIALNRGMWDVAERHLLALA
jgi:hypothetical protein